jgi:inhibitor of KinA sporulation pathway (predicted exonuclease)
MGAELNFAFVVDVEATCWETKEEQGAQPNEVIEIGICVLELKTGKILDPSGYVIRPRHTKVTPFCTQLTGWTQEDVDGGADIVDTLSAIIADYGITKNHIWFSCGEYDRIKLTSTDEAGSLGRLYGIRRSDNPFAYMRSHVNIKTLFAMKHKLQREKGMEGMLNMIGEKLEGRHHNGMDDACNIAKIVRHVLL